MWLVQCCREYEEESGKRTARWKGIGRGCEGRRGLYVKGGRARCYLACSPDEISASSFRPSSPPLLPRSFPPSLPSSYAFFLFLFCFCPAYALSPAGFSVMLLRGEKFFRACHCQTFDCVGISLYLTFFFSSRFLFFLFKFILSSAAFLRPHLFVYLFSDFLFLAFSLFLFFFSFLIHDFYLHQ